MMNLSQLSKDVMLTGLLFAGACFVFVFLRWIWLRSLSERRLDDAFAQPEVISVKGSQGFPRRYRLVALAVGLLTALMLLLLLRLPLPFVVSGATLVTVIGMVTESALASRQVSKIEEQLIYALEIISGSLRAGNGLTAALRSAHSESREPLRSHLRIVLSQVLIGEDPLEAIHALSHRVPLDTFRFFTVTLCVHWESGGSVANTLLSIAKVIRDRVEMMRRVQAESAEVHASVVTITVVSYLLTYLLWRTDPANMTQFLRSTPGIYLCSFAITMQAVGIAWVSLISRFKY